MIEWAGLGAAGYWAQQASAGPPVDMDGMQAGEVRVRVSRLECRVEMASVYAGGCRSEEASAGPPGRLDGAGTAMGRPVASLCAGTAACKTASPTAVTSANSRAKSTALVVLNLSGVFGSAALALTVVVGNAGQKTWRWLYYC